MIIYLSIESILLILFEMTDIYIYIIASIELPLKYYIDITIAYYNMYDDFQ